MFEKSNSLCRLCLSEEILDDIFKIDGCYQWISDYLSIQINASDQKCQTICAICYLKLTEFHEFRTRCLEVQEVLQTRADKPNNQSTIKERQEVFQIKSEKHNNQPSIEEGQLVLQIETEKSSTEPTKASPNPQTVRCGKCSKLCKSKKHLWNHTQHYHKQQVNGEQFHCEVCKKVFETKYKLKDHVRYHNPTNKHVCSQCGKSFDRKGRLRNHMYACILRRRKQLNNLEENAANTKKYTLDLLQLLEAEENSSSTKALPVLPQKS